MRILKFGLCGGVAVIAGCASVWNADEGVSSYLGFLKTPLEFGAYAPAILLLIAIISVWQMISSFFAKPVEKADIQRVEDLVKAEAKSLSEEITEDSTINYALHAKGRLQSASQFEKLQAQLDRMESKLGPEERKSFEDAVRDILNSEDARKLEAKTAVEDGRYTDAADHILKVGLQTKAAAADFRQSALKDFREAGTLFMLTDTARAIEAFELAVADNDEDPWTYIYLSRLYQKRGDAQGGRQILETVRNFEKHAQMAIEIEIGDIETAQANITKAKGNYGKALEIAKSLAKMNPKNASYRRDISINYDKLGNMEKAQGNFTDAKVNYDKALEIAINLMEEDPNNDQYKCDLSVSYNKLGDIEKTQGNIADAKVNYEKALEIAIDLMKMDPHNTRYKSDLSVSYNRLGDIEKAQGNLTKANANYKKGLTIQETLTEMDPNNAQYKRNLSISYENLGDIETMQGNLTKANANYENGLQIRETLAEMDPDNGQYKGDLSTIFQKLGYIEFSKGNFPAASDLYEKAREIWESLTLKDSLNADYKRGLALSLTKLALCNPDTEEANIIAAYDIMKDLSDTGQMQPADQDWFNALEATVRDD